jgi:hypothetical protein
MSKLGLERRKRPGLTAKEFMAQTYGLAEPRPSQPPTDQAKKEQIP